MSLLAAKCSGRQNFGSEIKENEDNFFLQKMKILKKEENGGKVKPGSNGGSKALKPGSQRRS